MNLKKYKTRSIFIKLIASYILLITLITVIIASVVYLYAQYRFNQEVKNSNEDIVNKYVNILNDTIIKKTESTMYDILLDKDLFNQISLFGSGNSSLFDVFLLHTNLKKFVNLNIDTLEGIHIYNEDSGELISTKYGYTNINTFNDLLKENLSWIYDMQNEGNSWLPIRNISFSYTGTDKRYITYIRYIPHIGNKNSAIAIDLKENQMLDILPDNDLNYNSSSITDQYGNEIIRDDNNADFYIVMDDFTADASNTEEIEIDGQKFVTSYATLENGWKLVRSIPVKAYYSASDTLLVTIITGSLIIMIIGFILSYFMSKSFYSPIALLASKFMNLMDNSKLSYDSYNNEFNYMNKALSEVSNTITQLNKSKNMETPIVKNNIVKNAIYNLHPTDEAFHSRLELVTRNEYSDNCLVILVHLSHIDEMYANQIINKKINLIKYIETMSNENDLFLATEISKNSIAILLMSDNTDITPKLNDFINYANNVLDIKIDISHGNWYSGILNFYKSYKEALTVYEHKFYMSDTIIFNYQLYDFDEVYDSVFFTKLQNDLNKALINNSVDKYNIILDMFLEKILNSNYDYNTKEICLYNFSMVIINYMARLESSEHNFAYYIEEYRRIDNIISFKEWYNESINNIILLKTKEKDYKSENIVYNMMEYIRDNLQNDLSLTKFSKETKLSKGYISKIFFESTGMHVTDYVTQIRMEHARNLLQTTEYKIELIAKKSGYPTPHYFAKKFKEYYGKTPKSYRIFSQLKA